MDSLVCALPEVPRRGDGAASKFEQVHSSIHHVSQANALLRKKLEAKHQPVALTRENLLQLEEIYETNKPAVGFIIHLRDAIVLCRFSSRGNRNS